MKRILFAFTCVSILSFMTGCKDYSCKGQSVCTGYDEVTNCTTDSYGNTRCKTTKECSSSVCCESSNRCGGAGCVDACGLMSAQTTLSLEGLQAKASKKLTINHLSVDRVMSAAANADLIYLNRLGLGMSDLERLSKNENLSNQSVQRMAAAVQESPEMVDQISRDLAQAFQKQRANIKSGYWQACVQSGRWYTNKNAYCRSTRWPGCSPAKGANLCVSKIGLERLKSMQD